MIVAMSLIQRYITSEKRKERKAMRGQHGKFSTHTAFFFANAHLWNELKNVMMISILLIFYLFLLGPYIVRTKVDQIFQVVTQQVFFKKDFLKQKRFSGL